MTPREDVDILRHDRLELSTSQLGQLAHYYGSQDILINDSGGTVPVYQMGYEPPHRWQLPLVHRSDGALTLPTFARLPVVAKRHPGPLGASEDLAHPDHAVARLALKLRQADKTLRMIDIARRVGVKTERGSGSDRARVRKLERMIERYLKACRARGQDPYL